MVSMGHISSVTAYLGKFLAQYPSRSFPPAESYGITYVANPRICSTCIDGDCLCCTGVPRLCECGSAFLEGTFSIHSLRGQLSSDADGDFGSQPNAVIIRDVSSSPARLQSNRHQFCLNSSRVGANARFMWSRNVEKFYKLDFRFERSFANVLF